MADQPQDSQDAQQPQHAKVRWERTDVRFRYVLAALVGFLCVAALNYYLVFEFFRSQENVREQARQSNYPLAPAPASELPPKPRLEQLDRLKQISGSAAAEQSKGQEQILHSYGSTDEQGFVRVPIEQAMKLVVGEIPMRKTSADKEPKDRGLVDYGDPNSGRILRGTSP